MILPASDTIGLESNSHHYFVRDDQEEGGVDVTRRRYLLLFYFTLVNRFQSSQWIELKETMMMMMQRMGGRDYKFYFYSLPTSSSSLAIFMAVVSLAWNQKIIFPCHPDDEQGVPCFVSLLGKSGRIRFGLLILLYTLLFEVFSHLILTNNNDGNDGSLKMLWGKCK